MNSSAPAAVESASWMGHGLALVALALGVGLWLVGGRAMRPALGLLGMLAGASLGWAIGEGFGDAIDTWVAVGTGAVTGLLIGVVMFRLTMALTLGAVLGVLAPLATATLIHHFGSPLEGTRIGDVAEERAAEGGEELRNLFLEGVPVVDGLDEARRLAEQGRETLGEERFDEGLAEASGADDATVEAVRRAGRFADALAREVQPVWEEMPVRDRMLLVLSMVTGWAMGLAIGMVLPRSAAALIAAGAGAGIWLVASVWLGTAAGVLGGEGGWVSIPSKPLAWIGVWGLVWMVGAAFQFTVLGRKGKQNASPAPTGA